MIETPGQLKSRIEAALDSLGFEALRALDNALPLIHPQLLELAYSVSARHAAWAKALAKRLETNAPDSETLELALDRVASAFSLYGLRLSAIGKREEALEAAQEAAALYRRLAGRARRCFSPAWPGISALSLIFTKQGQHLEAAGALKQALEIVVPFVERLPQVFSQLTRNLAGDYLTACEAADVELETILLKRLAWAVTSVAPAEQQRLMAAMTAILEKSEAINELDRARWPRCRRRSRSRCSRPGRRSKGREAEPELGTAQSNPDADKATPPFLSHVTLPSASLARSLAYQARNIERPGLAAGLDLIPAAQRQFQNALAQLAPQFP